MSMLSFLWEKHVTPEVGSVLLVRLLGENLAGAYHSGVYLGDGYIAELANLQGRAVVRTVRPETFIGSSFLRMGFDIEVGAVKSGMQYWPLCHPTIARRARDLMGDKGDYGLFGNNCHMFTSYCITGEWSDRRQLFPSDLEKALREVFPAERGNPFSWMPTGFSRFDA